MGLAQLNFEGRNRVEVTIARLQEFEALTKGEGFYFADSFGKDSCVTRRLLQIAGSKYDGHYNQTGIDPPELVRFGREYHPEVVWQRPKMNMWKGIAYHGMPSRLVRWCCDELKEQHGAGRYIITGIRWQESARRKTRKMLEICQKDKTKIFVNPIIDWTTKDVWEFIKLENIPYCSLYDEGFDRLGCVLCPMISGRKLKHEMNRFPKLAEAWHRACIRRFNTRQDLAFYQKFADAETYWQWWLSRKGEPKVGNAQCIMFDN